MPIKSEENTAKATNSPRNVEPKAKAISEEGTSNEGNAELTVVSDVDVSDTEDTTA